MDARLTEDQEQLRATAERIAHDLAPESPVQLTVAGDDAGAWGKLADAGLLGIRLPEAAGGSALSGVEVALVAEQLGRFCVPLPFIGSAVCASQLLREARAADDLLRALAGGTLRLSPALDAGMRGWCAPGRDGIAFEAAGAAGALVAAPESGGLCVLELGATLESQDLTRTLRGVQRDARRVDVGDLGGPLDPDALDRAQALTLAALAADLVGVMQAALDRAVAYTCEREQFGVKVATFQALQHMAAESLVSLEAARSVALYAAWAVDALPAREALDAARVAKAYASQHAREVCEASIQMHGGIGMTWEAMPHVYLRRALLGRLVLGDEHHHHAHLANAWLGEASREDKEEP